MGSKIDLTGKRFGRLVVVDQAPSRGTVLCWNCRCDCGNVCVIRSQSLRSGLSRSCGCYSTEKKIERGLKHGKSRHTIYKTWAQIRDRCGNPNSPSFKNYGGRGIAVCDRWQTFENFWNDMELTWKPGLTIERRNNDLGYSPENCEWIPRARQSRNRRNIVLLDTPWGLLPLAEAARASGISKGTLTNRVRAKWPQDKMFSAPMRSYDHKTPPAQRRLPSP